MRVVLLSTYELGRQPFGLASPAAWLRSAGHHVTSIDLARSPLHAPLNEQAVRDAHLIATYLPMHTATRLTLKLSPRLRALNPTAHLCAYGLYAPLNQTILREHGFQTILGGEFEQALLSLVSGDAAPALALPRQQFLIPDRTGLPALSTYAQLIDGPGTSRITGYTEATRGCKHLCRHCPVVPVYNGTFRVIQREIVLADIRQQVHAGARHITFGDPDFFNGPGHAIAIVEALHHEFPGVTYDATIKIEHLLNHRRHLPALRRSGCAFIVSAVESINDRILELIEKGHTQAGFLEAIHLMREAGIPLAPTFIPFTPWTTQAAYRELLHFLADHELIPNVAAIQLGIRLLIPEGSRLLELPEVRQLVGPFDPVKLTYPWVHSDPEMDRLSSAIQSLAKLPATRAELFAQIWDLAHCGYLDLTLLDRATIPYLTEPWYC